ncbi:MAG: Ig-like domain-containing protein [Paludibacteraceae bacterium]|nr:Ig-like domain-containing protein [Paludibacteraceae bacterium]
MKANKFFALAMAALAVVACNPNDPEKNEGQTGDVTITLDKESINLEVGNSELLTATVTPAGTAVTWTSLNPSFATVDNGLVTAVAEGTTIILATAGTARAQCQVVVGKGSTMGGNKYTLKEASEYYPIYVDADTKEKMGSKVKIDFTVEDVKNHWWPWVIEGTELLTYDILTASGSNFYGTAEGAESYMSLSATANGACWAGAGYSVQADELQQLIDAINAEPDNFYFHMGLRQTDGFGNAFYFFGMEADTKFVIGASSIYSGTVYADFKRDGYWYEFDIPMSKYAAALSGYKVADHLKTKDGKLEDPYIFSYLTAWNGTLNYDALFFYKK